MSSTACIHARPVSDRADGAPCSDCVELLRLRDLEHFVRKLLRVGARPTVMQSLCWALGRVEAARSERPGAIADFVSTEAQAAAAEYERREATTLPAVLSTTPPPESGDDDAAIAGAEAALSVLRDRRAVLGSVASLMPLLASSPSRLTCPECEGATEVTTAVTYHADPDNGAAAGCVDGEAHEVAATCGACKGSGRRICEDCGEGPADLVVDEGRLAVCARCLAKEAHAQEEAEVLARGQAFREVFVRLDEKRGGALTRAAKALCAGSTP